MALKELRTLTKVALAEWEELEDEAGNEKEYVCEGTPSATWWQQKTPGTSYWRCHVPARHLPGQSLALRFSDLKIGADGEVLMPRHQGAMIAQFVGNATRALVMAHQMNQGTRVLMEVDDNYLVPAPHTPNVRSAWQAKIDRSPADNYSNQAHRKILSWVDGIIVATEELAARYAQVTQAPIYHCPNSIDLDDWPGHSEGFRAADKGADESQGRSLAIGYAGSDSHRFDLANVDRGLDWAWRQPKVELWKIGAQTVHWRYQHTRMPWTDTLADYRANLRSLDVGLCPLKRGDWHDCKSDIKAMEYLLAGAVPIVQRDSPCYRDWVDVVPSATTEKDWLNAIKWCVQSPREEVQDAWQRGYDFLLKNKLIEQHIAGWRKAITWSV